jgi:hypothetical protein
VLAYADGKIELPKPGRNSPIKSLRNAPNFSSGLLKDIKEFDKPYNAESIAQFLGWMTPKGQVSPRVV